jgi:hypothetical protein
MARGYGVATDRIGATGAFDLAPDDDELLRIRSSSRTEYLRPTPVATTIEGGRANGYRTAPSRASPAVGRWRADVSNENGQLIGRVKFDVTP